MYTKGKLGLSADHLSILGLPTKEDSTYIPIAKMKYEPWMDDVKEYRMNCETAQANAAELVKRWNSHKDLVDVLGRLLKEFDPAEASEERQQPRFDLAEEAEAALAAAKKKT